jgi:hypothetical protein
VCKDSHAAYAMDHVDGLLRKEPVFWHVGWATVGEIFYKGCIFSLNVSTL